MSVSKTLIKKVVLTQAQFDARQTAGTLQEGVEYQITDAPSGYIKPATGIPASDMASAVQTSLGLADTALQSHQSLAAYRTSSAQDTIDAGKVAVAQGVAKSGQFLVVGSDGNVTTQTLQAWQGGSY